MYNKGDLEGHIQEDHYGFNSSLCSEALERDGYRILARYAQPRLFGCINGKCCTALVIQLSTKDRI